MIGRQRLPGDNVKSRIAGLRFGRATEKAARYSWIRRLLPFIRPRPGNIVLAFVAVVVAGVASAGLLLVQRQVLDLAVAGRINRMLVPLGLLLVLCALVYAIQRMAAYREIKAANGAQSLIYEAVHRRMQEIDADGQALPAGQLAARLNVDIDALSRAVAMLPRLAGQALSTTATAVLMLMLSPVLATPTLVIAPLLVLISRRSRRRIQPATWEAQQREADIAQLASEAIAGVRVVKALGQEQREIDRMRAGSIALYDARIRLLRLQSFFQPVLGSVASLVQVSVFALGGWLMLHHQMTLGTFLAFSSFSGQLVSTIQWFADTIIGLQEAGVSADRVLDLLDLPPAVVEAPDAYPLPPVRGEVRLEAVRYAYSDGPAALDGISLTIAPGETVALVGASGSGKSTIVKLLARFHDPQHGVVRLDGTDLREVTLTSLRHQVAMVFDEPMLFTGTIRDNITFGRPDADDTEVIEAARAAGAHDFITGLTDGYATAVGERGYTLSGGQRQRVALARALLTKPKVLVLDDATGGVDAELEREIYCGLRANGGGRTTIFVAYRASAMALADRIVVLEAGRIVAEGRHRELLERSALYRSLIEAERSQDTMVEALAPLVLPPRAAAVPAEPRRKPGPTGPDQAPKAAVQPPSPEFSPLRLLWPHRAVLGMVLALFVLQTGMGVLGPYVTRIAVDYGVLAGSARNLVRAAVVMVGMSLAGLLIAPLTIRLSGKVGQRVIVDLRQRVWGHMVRLPIGYYERQKAGRLLTRVVNDVESFSDFATNGVATFVVSGLTAAGVLVAMLLANLRLGALVALTVVPFILLLRRLNRKIVAAYIIAREQVAEANAVLQENLAGARETQAFSQQDRQHASYKRLVGLYLDARLTAENLIIRSYPFLSFLSSMAGALVLGVGAVMLARGSLTAGDLIAFILWSNAFYAPIIQIGQFSSDFKRVQVSTRRIKDLVAEVTGPPSPVDPVRPVQICGELVLRDVRFEYPGTTAEVLRGVNLTVPPGSTVALVGVTGIGKSTIFKLLARFYDPSEGQVLLDGIDLRELDSVLFRGHMGYLPQEPFLFSGSIRDNVSYGRPQATDAEIEAAAREVGAHHGISALAGGYGHVVGERGAGLPAGLRQLICMARVYLMDPAILLLDEATARLDLATEMRVLDAVRAVARGRTTVIIAHRLQTAMIADYIALVGDGRIAEWGSHDELLAANDRYAELFRASTMELALDPA